MRSRFRKIICQALKAAFSSALKTHMGRGKPLEKKNYQEEHTIFGANVFRVRGGKSPVP